MLICTAAFGQKIEVTGKVVDANGPIGGVNIVEKGTSNGSSTDFDGFDYHPVTFASIPADKNNMILKSWVSK